MCFTAEFSILGAGIFVQESVNIVSSSVTNNTALYWKYYNRVDVYCYSNSTNDHVTIVLPSGLELNSSVYYNSYTVQKINPAGFRFTSSQNRIPPKGIYTCRVFTSQKMLWEMSFGVYSSAIIGELSAKHKICSTTSVFFLM